MGHAERVLFVLAFAASATTDLSHRRPRLDAGRIVNGYEVPHSQFPFLVSIEYHEEYTGEWSSTCGGSIVNRVTILTACHCATSDEKIHGFIKYLADPKKRRVVAGTAYWKNNTPNKQIAKVEKIVTHPKCQNFNLLDRNFLNDVALYFLKGPLVYGPEVQPIKLPSTDILKSVKYLKKLIYNGAWCTAVGWGRTVENDSRPSEKLLCGAVQLLQAEACRKRFCKMSHSHCQTDFDSVGQFCVASPVASNCYGDSGGPLICNGFVVGTVSYGVRCLPNFPTVYQSLEPAVEVLSVYNVKVDCYRSGFGGELNATLDVQAPSPAKHHRAIYKTILSYMHEIRVLLDALLNKKNHNRPSTETWPSSGRSLPMGF